MVLCVVLASWAPPPLRPPRVHLMSFTWWMLPGLPRFNFRRSSIPCIVVNANRRSKRGRPGTEARLSLCYNLMCFFSTDIQVYHLLDILSSACPTVVSDPSVQWMSMGHPSDLLKQLGVVIDMCDCISTVRPAVKNQKARRKTDKCIWTCWCHQNNHVTYMRSAAILTKLLNNSISTQEPHKS